MASIYAEASFVRNNPNLLFRDTFSASKNTNIFRKAAVSAEYFRENRQKFAIWSFFILLKTRFVLQNDSPHRCRNAYTRHLLYHQNL